LTVFQEEGCYSSDTKMLTRNGWKLLSELTDEDEVATRSESGLFQWQKPSGRLEYPFDGEMVEFSSKSVELLVTPGHRMLVKRPDAYLAKHAPRDGETGWHIRLAEHIARAPETRWLYPVTSRWCLSQWSAEFVLPGWEADRRHPAWEHATEWLARFLVKDWTPSAEVVAAYKAAGISEKAYIAARENLGVKKRRIGGSRSAERWWEVSAPTGEYVPSSGAYQPMRELRVPMRDFCAFLGVFLAEGWVRADRDDVIVSQTSGSRHLSEIHQILAATGLHWDYDARNSKFTTSHLTLAGWLRENCGSRAWGKRVPREFLELPQDMLEALLHGMMLGDGHWSREGQRRYTTTSAQLADDVQEIFQRLGRDAWVRPQDLSQYAPGDPGHGRAIRRTGRMQYVVHERMGEYHWLPKPKMTEYHGTVYSVTVPNAIVYVRRNGKAIWCGDSSPRR
jgi:hypothetical protein